MMPWLRKPLLIFLMMPSLAALGFDRAQFIDLEYDGKSPNTVTFGKTLTIQVDDSGSPLFYRFKKPVKTVVIEGRISDLQLPQLPPEDAYFSVGVVYAGDYRPNFIERLFVPNWILKILNSVPNEGISNIEFFDAVHKGHAIDYKKSLAGIPVHRQSHSVFGKDGRFRLTIPVGSQKSLGLWIRSDGDETHTKFQVEVQKISTL